MKVPWITIRTIAMILAIFGAFVVVMNALGVVGVDGSPRIFIAIIVLKVVVLLSTLPALYLAFSWISMRHRNFSSLGDREYAVLSAILLTALLAFLMGL